MRPLIIFYCLLFSVIGHAQVQFNKEYDIISESGFQNPSGFIKTADNGYAMVVVGSQSGIQIVKTDSVGQVEWNRAYSGQFYFGSITEKSSGGYWIASSHFDTTASLYTRVLISLDDIGNLLWISGDEDSGVFSTGIKAIELQSSVLLIGNRVESTDSKRKFTVSNYDFNGNILWQKQYHDSLNIEVRDAKRIGANEILVTGIGWAWITGNVLKIDTSGNVIWHTAQLDDNILSGIEPLAINTCSNGDILITGRRWVQSWDIMAMRLTPLGDFIWGKNFVDNLTDDEGYSIHETANGSILICAEPETPSVIGSQTAILRLNSNGDLNLMRIIQPNSNSFPFESIMNSDESLTIFGTQGSWASDTTISLMRTNASLETICPYLDTNYLDSSFTATSLQFSASSNFSTQSSITTLEQTFSIEVNELCSSSNFTELFRLNEVKIYPNPSTTVVYIDQFVNKIELYDYSGRLILSKEHSNFIDVQHISNGTYVIKLTLNEMNHSSLMIIG